MSQREFWNVVHAARTARFEWGVHDCVTFGMRCAVAFTGDSSIEQRTRDEFGKWSSAREAVEAHGGDLRGAVTKILGDPVPWTRLTLGSLAIAIDEQGREVIAIHDGVQLLVPVEVGLNAIPPDRALCGWRLKP